MTAQQSIAIVGAGLSGLVAARQLSTQAQVTLFDKSRGVGGRMSTRRAPPFAFDHGTQYFTAKTEGFQAFLTEMQAAKVVSPWHPRLVEIDATRAARPVAQEAPYYVASPGMNALCKHLAAELDLRLGLRVTGLTQASDGWHLALEDGTTAGGFDQVLITTPVPQALPLLPSAFSQRERLAAARMSGCFTLMLGYDAPVSLGWDAARITAGPLGWVAANHAKPGRAAASSLVVQSTNAWAEAHMEDALTEVEAQLLAALAEIAPDLPAPAHTSLHRWRYAAVETPAGLPVLHDPALGLAAAGDWCLRGRVEAAFESGQSAAAALLA